ncbi:MAG TPA: hypothetical protein VEQ37_00150 [Actinomycetota bacterium]|nr:hypothetical protein [Actinomycetota bacterium]
MTEHESDILVIPPDDSEAWRQEYLDALPRTCKTCGTVLSRYNTSQRYCFVHQPPDLHSRDHW